ncbi:MAG: Hpt domain-containing protein [Deltaproteobacteria bacterium]|nr:MAG: Hpt domain-containing protein [Deltaproteobacteria bacterium]
MDIAKYRNLFLEEATEHLAEMSRSLLALEKEPELREAIEAVFRAAHSIKSMAASLSYDSIRSLAHRLEDRMERVRSAGRLEDPEDLGLLFRGLEALEQMVAVVRESGEAPPDGDAELLAALSGPAATEPDPKKKAHDPAPVARARR